MKIGVVTLFCSESPLKGGFPVYHTLSTQIDMKVVKDRFRDMVCHQYPSIRNFAKCVGVKPQTIHRFLNEGKLPSTSVIVAICERLGCSVDFLLGLSSPDVEAKEALTTTLLNIRTYGPQWGQKDRLTLIAIASGLLTPSQEKRLVDLSQSDRQDFIPL